jgi:hypothetical protein
MYTQNKSFWFVEYSLRPYLFIVLATYSDVYI